MKRPTFADWDRFWCRDAAPHPIALLRIALGAFLLFYFGLQAPHVALFYSREGLHMPLFATDSWATVLFAPPPAGAAWIVFSALLVSLLLFTVGFLTRVSGAVAFLIYCYYWILTLFQFGTSFDRLFIFSMLVLVWSGCGKALSVDMKLRHGSIWAWEITTILPQRILAVQVTMTYLGVGWQKLFLPAWQSGLILIRGFIGRWATPPAWAIAQAGLPLSFYDVNTWLIKAFEFAVPFSFWHPKTRWWGFLGGTLFHVGIAILLAIWWFVALIPAYVVFFSPEETLAFLRRHFPIPPAPAGSTAVHPEFPPSLTTAQFRGGTTANV